MRDFCLTQWDCTNKNCRGKDEDDQRSSTQYFDQPLNQMLADKGSHQCHRHKIQCCPVMRDIRIKYALMQVKEANRVNCCAMNSRYWFISHAESNRQVKNITVRDGKTLQEVVFYNRHGRRKCHRESCCSTRDLEKDFLIKLCLNKMQVC